MPRPEFVYIPALMSKSKCYAVKKSSIHGRGLFAARKIRRGEVVGVYEGEPTARDGAYVLWVCEEDGTQIGIKGETPLRFVNHSVTPNSEFHGQELSALRTIEPGDEITCHYGEDWE